MTAMPPLIVGTATDEAANFVERYPGYRSDLISALADSIREQNHQATQRHRLEKVTKIVEALGTQVISKPAVE